MEHTFQNTTVNCIHKLLKIKNIKQKDLAAQMDISRQMISNYLNEKTELTLNMTERIAEAMGVPVKNLFLDWSEQQGPYWVQNGDSQIISNNSTIKGSANKNAKKDLDVIKLKDQLIEQQQKEIDFLRSLLKK